MFERILVPLDGSEVAEAVMPYVRELARGQGSEVDVVGVSDPPGALERLLKTYLDRIAEGFLAEGTKARAVILMGRVAEEIIDYAEQNDISLIAMATHGRSGVTRWALGSVADRVLRGGSVPLLMINPRLAPGPREGGKLFENILLPLDGSKLSEMALPYAQGLAKRSATRVCLLRVSPPRHLIMDTGEYMVTNVEETVRGLEGSALAYLSQVEESLKGTGL
ncbi:MAG: universal stress protein, partial [Dehalococcoidia bacterium]